MAEYNYITEYMNIAAILLEIWYRQQQKYRRRFETIIKSLLLRFPNISGYKRWVFVFIHIYEHIHTFIKRDIHTLAYIHAFESREKCIIP